jgi:hypothetical protein
MTNVFPTAPQLARWQTDGTPLEARVSPSRADFATQRRLLTFGLRRLRSERRSQWPSSIVISRRKRSVKIRPPAALLDVDGVRLHYVERGSGESLVLLHGNGSMIEDLESTQPGTSASSFSTVPDSATATGRAR